MLQWNKILFTFSFANQTTKNSVYCDLELFFTRRQDRELTGIEDLFCQDGCVYMNREMELVFPTTVLYVFLQSLRINGVKLEARGRARVWLNFTLLYFSHKRLTERERSRLKKKNKKMMQVLVWWIQYISDATALRLCLG